MTWVLFFRNSTVSEDPKELFKITFRLIAKLYIIIFTWEE
jgi:hypothetical protein